LGVYKKTVSNFVIFLLTTVTGRAITFLLLPIYSYRLSLEEFGQYELLLAVTAVLIPFFTLCSHEAVLKNCIETDDIYIRIKNLFNSFVVLFLQTVILSLLIVLIFLLFDIRDFLPLSYLIGFALSSSMFEILSKYSKAIGCNKIFSFSSLILAFTIGLSTYLGVYIYDGGLDFVLNSYLIGYFASIVYILIALKIPQDFFRYKLNFDVDLFKGMMTIGLPLIPNALMWWVMNLSDRWFIGYFLSFSDLGVYSVANKVSSLIIVFNGILFQTWQVHLYDKKNTAGSYLGLSVAFNFYVSILGLACLFLVVINKEFLHLVLSNDYAAGWYEGNILILSAFLFGISSALGVFYVMEGRTALALKSSASAALLNVIFNFILIPNFGLVGAAYSTVLSSAWMFFLRRFDVVVRKYVGFSFSEWLVLIFVFISVVLVHLEFGILFSVVFFALSSVLVVFHFVKFYRVRNL
jgi:O-antigen/teichoic acid export membrane protein